MRKCSYCGKEAYWETFVVGIDLCENPDCHNKFVEDQSEPIEETE